MIIDHLMTQSVAEWSNMKKQGYWFWIQDFLIAVEDMIFSRRSPTEGQDAREPWENELLPSLEWIIRWQENMTLFSTHCTHMQSLADLGDILSDE